jgi:hypothetical protein
MTSIGAICSGSWRETKKAWVLAFARMSGGLGVQLHCPEADYAKFHLGRKAVFAFRGSLGIVASTTILEASLLRRIALAARCAINIERARGLSSRGDGSRATRVLDRVCDDLEGSELPVQVHLLRAQVAIQVDNGPLALSSAERALDQLETGDGPYKQEDRDYLIEFARSLIHYCETWRDQGATPSTVNLSLLRLSKVSGHLRKDFPMPADGSFV